MKTPSLSLCALFVCFVMLTACSQAPGLSRSQYEPSIDPNHKTSPLSFYYTSLYSFGADPDGREPAGLSRYAIEAATLRSYNADPRSNAGDAAKPA
jgi:hypothetical protein